MFKWKVATPILEVTNPILLWLFAHGWEDPEWGRLPINQVALGLILQNIGDHVVDAGSKKQLQEVAARIVSLNAHAEAH